MRAYLQACQPLRAQRVEAVNAEAGTDVVLAATFKVIDQIQTQAQVVRACAASGRVDKQRIVTILVHYLVGDATEVVGTVNGAHVGLQASEIKRLADFLPDHGEYHFVSNLAAVVDFYSINDCLALGASTGKIAAANRFSRVDERQRLMRGAQAGGTSLYRLGTAFKAVKAHITQLWL